MLKLLIENYEILKATYEYCLKHFMYPNYDKVPNGTVYHNLHLEYVDFNIHNGILLSNSRQLEYSGEMIWATTLPNQKGYGGCTIAFTLDGLKDKQDYEMVNNTEYCIYTDILPDRILFVDLPVAEDSGGCERLSDIPHLINEYGLEKVQKVFNKYYSNQYIPLDAILPYIK